MTDKEIEVIVKPIFTKMFNSNFSACEYGIECYKKGMEYQGIKELAIENDNLIKRVKELEQKLEHTEKDLADYQFNYPKIKELEKENAELKKWQKDTIKARGKDYMDWSRMKDQLTKATKLLKWALHSDPEHDNLVDFDTKWKEAEQFLKEIKEIEIKDC